MFQDPSDEVTHRDRWDTYVLPYPHSAAKRKREEGGVEISSVPSYQQTARETESERKAAVQVFDAADEHAALLAKASFAPSPYVHFAKDTRKKKVGLAALTVLIFYCVSGGPFGVEPIVQAGGPLFALLGFSLLLVWAVPEALVTAELSTAMPEASGSVAWVDCAFGQFWAFQKGWLSWLSGISDNALYPILFLDCLVSLLSTEDDPSIFSQSNTDQFPRLCFIFTVTLLLTYLNYRGLDVVGNVAIVICLVALFPFVVFCVLGAFKVQPHRWLRQPEGGLQGVNWGLLLNTFFWNINFWESAASFSGEVEDPGRNYPKGMGYAVLLVFFSAFLPILIGTGASDAPYSQWTDGYFITLAKEIVGPWLAYWLMLGSALTNIGMFEAEMSSDAWQVAGMADRGILPSVLGTRNKYDTPTYGILLSAIGVAALGFLSFTQVVDMLNLLFCFGQAIEFCAFLHLRRVRPDMPRPYRIPIGFYGMCGIMSVPMFFILVIMYFSSWMSLVITTVLAAIGVMLYYLLEIARERQWCAFEDRCAAEPVPSPSVSMKNERTPLVP